MRQKALAILLVFIFAVTSVCPVYAKGSSGGRSSGGSRSFSSSSKSGGYSGSSKSSGSSSRSVGGSYSKSSGSSGSSSSGSSKSSGSSGSGYSGSSKSTGSSRSVPGSYSGGSSSKTGGYSGSSGSTGGAGTKSSSGTGSVSSKTNTQKNTYMQDYYKQQTSSANFKTYNQTLNADQRKVYDSSMNTRYNVGNRMSFEDSLRTRPQRINVYTSRPIRINVINFGGPFSYGYAYVGPWDLWFLMRASDLFWYHHWADIYPYRSYFDAVQFAQMEARIRALEAQNIARDPNYMEPGVDPDLQFSNDYLQKNPGAVYYTSKYSQPVGNPVVTVIVIILIVVLLVFILRKVSKPRPRRPSDSRIY